MNKPEKILSDDLSEALTYPVDAFISREYAEAEAERLWSKVWQQAGRVEEIPNVGDYITYNIVHDSILIVRAAPGDGPDAIRAYHNVCPHRGRRLVGDNTGGGPVVLKQAKGAAFDDLYAAQQVGAHEEALGLLEDYATSGTDPALREFAGKAAPTVERHLDAARKLS